MIFNEIYSVYFQVITRIIEKALGGAAKKEAMDKIVMECAFADSNLEDIPVQVQTKWHLLNEDYRPILTHRPLLPLSLPEKRWLKAICSDPRIQLFDVQMPELASIEPLFLPQDICYYDRCTDGDPFTDPTYIRIFRFLLAAVAEQKTVELEFVNQNEALCTTQMLPQSLEYSLKDDKFRLLSCDGERWCNLARIRSCRMADTQIHSVPTAPEKQEILMELVDERNALERVMLHFADFEKQAEKTGASTYRIKLRYVKADEMELVIRILSFGTQLRICEPEAFVQRIRDRLAADRKSVM